MKEPLALHRRRRLHHWRHRTDRTLRKINAGHRLIDLQCPRLAGLGVNMVPVVQAKRHVAVLLHFKHHDVAAQRVNGPGRYEDAVAGLRSEACEVVRHRSVRERPPQIVCRGAWLQARVDAAFWPRLQHHPGFGLPGLARRQQVRMRIRGMHLDREHFARVEELQQQRESAETPGQFSQHLLRRLLKQLADGPPLERSIGDAARMVIAVAE